MILFLIKYCLITIVIELITLLFLGEKRYRVYALAIIINLISNPLMNLILIESSLNYYLLLVNLELGVVLIEGIAYFCVYPEKIKALKVSFLLNMASLIFGLLII